jgi:hypothetical protein
MNGRRDGRRQGVRSRRFFVVSVRPELYVSSSYLVKIAVKSRGRLPRGGRDAVPQLEWDRLPVGSMSSGA